MTTCALVFGIISCVSATPKLTPAQAAEILAPHQFVYVAPVDPFRQRHFSTNSIAGARPFGPFKPFPPRTRLDETLPTQPPTIYGAPPLYPYRQYPFVTGLRTHSVGVSDVQRGTPTKTRSRKPKPRNLDMSRAHVRTSGIPIQRGVSR